MRGFTACEQLCDRLWATVCHRQAGRQVDKKHDHLAVRAGTWILRPHPDSEHSPIKRIEVDLTREAPATIRVRYRLVGDISGLRLSSRSSSSRRNELWKHTCFELFLSGPAESYYEFNFSPSTQWAAYRFEAYRQGMADLPIDMPPRIEFEHAPGALVLNAVIDLHDLMDADSTAAARVALAAVVEHGAGHISYWALVHRPGKADFHHPDSFVAKLPDNVS